MAERRGSAGTDRSVGFWRDRRVLLTGHTGFKGAWMAACLEGLGASVTGLALEPATMPHLFGALAPWQRLASRMGDIRDPSTTRDAVAAAEPEVVVHMAAQALVRAAHRDPMRTIETNVLGTAYLLDALRECPSLRAVLVVTSDKVYANDGAGRAFSERDRLGGADPYSGSKAAADIVATALARSYFDGAGVAVGVARGGNVIGGGDWAPDRLIPDLWRAGASGQPAQLRYPSATRPWQHVLDVVAGYLAYCEALASSAQEPPKALNFGPLGEVPTTVAQLATRVCEQLATKPRWRTAPAPDIPESPALVIDASLACGTLPWSPKLRLQEAIAWTCDWYNAFDAGQDMRAFSERQIEAHAAR